MKFGNTEIKEYQFHQYKTYFKKQYRTFFLESKSVNVSLVTKMIKKLYL